MNKHLLSLCFIFLFLSTQAQDRKSNNTLIIGLSKPLLDDGSGIFFGYNPYLGISNRFGIEGQVSYLRTKVKSTFISGRDGRSGLINALGGGRYYLNDEYKRIRPYVHLLIGFAHLRERTDGLDTTSEYKFGLSTGAYLQFYQRVLLGLAFDSEGNVILKGGFVF